MKRIERFAIVAALVMAMALCACASSTPSTQGSRQASGQGPETTQAQSSAPSSQQDEGESAQAAPAAQGPGQTDGGSVQFESQAGGGEFSARTRTWAVIGDSLTDDTFRAKTKYYDYVSQDLGCTVVNYGKMGTGYMANVDGDSFCTRVDAMSLEDVDCVTIFGSFNDLGKGYELGTADDEGTYSIGGCMNRTIDKLVAKNPDLKIGIVTPTPWRTNFSYTVDGEGSFDTVTSYDCEAYVELLKDVARRHRLPVLDLYETCGLDPDDEQVRDRLFNYKGKKDEGGVHPNSDGHKFMYPLWREFVKTLLPSDAVG